MSDEPNIFESEGVSGLFFCLPKRFLLCFWAQFIFWKSIESRFIFHRFVTVLIAARLHTNVLLFHQNFSPVWEWLHRMYLFIKFNPSWDVFELFFPSIDHVLHIQWGQLTTSHDSQILSSSASWIFYFLKGRSIKILYPS